MSARATIAAVTYVSRRVCAEGLPPEMPSFWLSLAGSRTHCAETAQTLAFSFLNSIGQAPELGGLRRQRVKLAQHFRVLALLGNRVVQLGLPLGGFLSRIVFSAPAVLQELVVRLI
jgi:hypothetical protein